MKAGRHDMSAGFAQRSLVCVDDMSSLPVPLDACNVTATTYETLNSEWSSPSYLL